MIIYKAQNKITNKVYIGKTLFTLEQRKNQHITHSLRKPTGKFHKALKSYGADNFEWSVVDTAKNAVELNTKEINYIKEYNSIKNGYNMIEGGTGGYNEYAVKANREKRKGKTWNDIYSSDGLEKMKVSVNKFKIAGIEYIKSLPKKKRIENAKLANKARTESGYKHSDETKKKIAISQFGITNEQRYGKEGAEKLNNYISQKTKEAMKKLDWDDIMKKALDGRKKYWNNKHESDRNKIMELTAKGFKVKEIIAELNISTPTYYARLEEIKKMVK